MVTALLRVAFIALWSAWFRWGRIPLSRLVNMWRPGSKTPVPRFASLEAFARWWYANTHWVADPIWGALDILPSLEHAQWCFEKKGRFEEDCDGLAYVGGHYVAQVPGVREVYLVTLVYDPFTSLPGNTLSERLFNIAHVIAVFRQGNKWGVISNRDVYAPQWDDFGEAVTQNPACRGRRILWYEVREISLRRVVARRVRRAGDIALV